MLSTLRTGLTLSVILLLFLAFNLVWMVKVPETRWDFSEHTSTTLSPAVQPLLSTLESPLDLYYFNSKQPHKSAALKRYAERVEALLKAYEKASNGMLNLHVINPTPFSEDAYKAGLYGLDGRRGFFGLIGTRAGQAAQRIEAFSPDRELLLEYEISHLISRLVNPEPATLGLLSAMSMPKHAAPLLYDLQRHFELVELKPATRQIPPQIKTLMVVHAGRLPEETLYAIDQFVLGGGKLMMFIDPRAEWDSSNTARTSRLDELLAGWGLQMPGDRVLTEDPTAAPMPLTVPRQAMTLGDVSSWRLEAMTVLSSGALFPLKSGRALFTPLLQSAAQLTPSPADEPHPRSRRQVIAARIEGPAYSAFPDGVAGQSGGLHKAAQIHVVVVADTDLLTLPSGNHGNRLFVLNTLDNLAAPAALASIRPRPMAAGSLRVLDTMHEAAAQAYQATASELQQRLLQTEVEWQRLNPPSIALGTEPVDANTQLQALNKERLRLPMELQALKVEAYAPVQRLERWLTLLVSVPIPALLVLIAWGLWRRRRRRSPAATFY